MKVELLGWESEGLRCADLHFDFSKNRSKLPTATLIQMPNGTGKTTTLNCIRAALTGEALTWDPAYVKQFARRNGKKGKGSFELKLRVDDKLLTIGIVFEFRKGAVRYYTTYDRGRLDKFNPPAALKRFFTPPFVRLLVFDGELPGELLDNRKTRAQEAVDAFFQLYLLRDVSSAIQRIFELATQKQTATHERGYTRRQNELKEAREKVETIKTAHSKASERLDKAENERADLQSMIDSETGTTDELTTQRDRLLAQKEFADTKRSQCETDLLFVIRQPHRIHPRFKNMLLNLRDHLDRLKLPESTSKQFFEELAEETTCVCGRPIDDQARLMIKKKATNYLGTDTYGALNHLKAQIQNLVIEPKEMEFAETLSKDLRSADHQCGAIETDLNVITQKLIDRGGEEVKAMKSRCDELDVEINDLKETLDEIERDPISDDGDDSICLKYWIGEKSRREKRLAEITKTVQMRNNKDMLIRMLADAHKEARTRLNNSIVKEMNDKIDVLLRGHNIKASALDQSVILEEQAGASLGQTLAVGYAFLTTLFKRGGHTFPFVVDAPVTALDGRVRKEVATIIPQVCPQFVAFILDTEKAHFVNTLESISGVDIHYLTAFEDTSKNEDMIELLPDKGVLRSENGIIVEGKEYFDRITFPDVNNNKA